ncbi:MAG: phosphoribosyltransferase [Planctomycetota bacterium]|jgi:putative phosphoribosyl transferase
MHDIEFVPFRDRKEAGERLAKELVGLKLEDPIVLAIPRGGVVIGAELAKALGAELDIVISRKLRVPFQPELAYGALGEDGAEVLDHHLIQSVGLSSVQMERERNLQWEQVQSRIERFRGKKPAASLTGRSVIVTDDGIATGSTMLAALQTVRAKGPRELIVAVPVAPLVQLKHISQHCDRLVCLHSPADFVAVGQFYDSFEPVEDQQVEQYIRREYAEPKK